MCLLCTPPVSSDIGSILPGLYLSEPSSYLLYPCTPPSSDFSLCSLFSSRSYAPVFLPSCKSRALSSLSSCAPHYMFSFHLCSPLRFFDELDRLIFRASMLGYACTITFRFEVLKLLCIDYNVSPCI